MRFSRGEVEQEEMLGVVAHLFSGCARCRQALARSAAGSLAQAPWEMDDAEVYRGAFERARAAVRERAAHLVREQAASRKALSRLASLPRRRQMLLVRNSRNLQSWAFCEALWSESVAGGEGALRRAELSELALAVAFELEKDRYGVGVATDLRARAAAELANALWQDGKATIARDLMVAALQLVENGTGDPLLRARIYDLAASVFPGEEPEGLAGRLLERAFHLYRRFGDDHLAGRVLVKKAVTGGAREPSGRLKLLLEAADLIDPQRDRWLACASIHCMLWGLVELGRHRAAAELLEESRGLYAEFGGHLDPHCLPRLEGRIAAGLSDEATAEKKLLSAYRHATRAGDLHDALLVVMDLSTLLLPQGRRTEARLLVEDLLSVAERAEAAEGVAAALELLRRELGEPDRSASPSEELCRLLARLEPSSEFRFEADL